MIRKPYITIFFLLIVSRLFPQAFSCDHTFYVVMQVDGKSVLHNLWLDEAQNLYSRTIPLSRPERRYTGLGLSVEDMHLYALDADTKELLRIDAEGTVISLGIPTNLDTTLEYRGGEVTPEGRRLVVIGYDKNFGKDRTVFSINLTSSNQYAGSAGLVSYLPTAITDLATDPIRGITYGYDKLNKQIVVIGTNLIAHHNHKQIEPIMESLFFDQYGNLYGYGSNSSETEQTTLYAIDKIKGDATPISPHTAGLFSDGCSCPATIRFTRTVMPSRILPCTEIEIDYQIINHSGIGKTGVVFEDILPPAFQILEIKEHTFTLATVESGVGTNQLYIPNLDVLLGENIIRITARLDATPETIFRTQAGLENLPIGLGGALLSDDPFTSASPDPNLTEVLQSEEIELEDYIRYNCGRDTAVLGLPFPARTYLWNDGSSNPTLSVTKAGLYWLEVTGECFTIKDSILIGTFPEPLHLDLGPDRRVKEGSIVNLEMLSNAGFIRQLNWSSSQDFDLSCTDCPSPSLQVQQDNTYYLTLTDGAGCSLVDSLRVSVIPARDLFVPNAFSPNGDGINDILYIHGNNPQALIREFGVMNRWGTLLFSSKGGSVNDRGHAWDGRINGRPAGNGVYIWFATVEFGDGSISELKGEVSLLHQ